MTKRTMLLVLAAALASASDGSAEERKLDMKKIADKIAQTINSRDPVAITNLYAEDAVMIMASEPQPVRGRPALLKSFQGLFKAFPDMESEWSLVLFCGETLVFEGVTRGTFLGPMTTPEGDVAPTGKRFQFRFAFLGKISPDGLIAEDRTYFDNLDFMRQLGLVK